MQAGAPGVVSTLWPVDDLSTAILMEQFYRNYIENGMSPDMALSEAQQWMKESTRAEMLDYYQPALKQKPAQLFSFMSHLKMTRSHEERPFANPHYWAAFTFVGK